MERMGNKFYTSTFLFFLFIHIGLASNSNTYLGDPIPKSKVLSLDIYPNPATTTANIIIEGSENAEIFILNSLGKLIKEIEMQERQTSLPVDDLDPGLYIIKVKDRDSDKVVSKRLLVRK